jgi:kynureninase
MTGSDKQVFTLAQCRAMDRDDPLSELTSRFVLPSGLVYLDGHSLGPMTRSARAAVETTLRGEWGPMIIGGWNSADWIGLPARTAARIAPLIGADVEETACADSVSVNLFKLAAGALSVRPERKTILAVEGEFPTDGYILQGLRQLRPDIHVRSCPADRLGEALDGDTALFLASHADYRTGALRDLPGLTKRAREVGALSLWDLSHTTGLARIDLVAAGADMAVGCGYKYLCGGPGAPAFAFLSRRHFSSFSSPIPGWMGHARPFAFEADYAPAAGAARLMAGTPPILSLSALHAALEIFEGVRPADLLARSRRLSGLFERLVEPTVEAHGFNLVSPSSPEQRGGHLAYTHTESYPIVQALIAAGVVGDFREPDLIRFGFSPLILSYAQIWTAARRFAEVMADGAWRDPAFHARRTVT